MLVSICSHKIESKALWKSTFSKRPCSFLLRTPWTTSFVIMNPSKIWRPTMNANWLTLIASVKTLWSLVDSSFATILYNPWIKLIGQKWENLLGPFDFGIRVTKEELIPFRSFLYSIPFYRKRRWNHQGQGLWNHHSPTQLTSLLPLKVVFLAKLTWFLKFWRTWSLSFQFFYTLVCETRMRRSWQRLLLYHLRRLGDYHYVQSY